MKIYYIPLLLLLFPLFSISQVASPPCQGWHSEFGQPGTFNAANVMLDVASRTYIGSSVRFGGIDSLSTLAYLDDNYVWHFVGRFKCTSCGTGRIESLAKDNLENIYIGGLFEGVEDAQGNYVASKNIIRYSPHTQTFTALGQGLVAGQVKGLAWRNDTLFAAGRITYAKNTNGDIPVNNIALYDETTSTWHAMGQGIGTHTLSTDDNGDVNDLELGSFGTLYAAGRFSKINGQDTVFSVAQWHPSLGWRGTAPGLFLAYNTTTRKSPPLINDLALDRTTGVLYATGYLGYTIGGTNVLASWDGTRWDYISGLGKPSNGRIFKGNSLYYHAFNRSMYVGGSFNIENAAPTDLPISNHIAAYQLDNMRWDSLGQGVTSTPTGLDVTAISKVFSRICISGYFTEVDHKPVNHLAGYSPSQDKDWIGFGGGAHESCDEINALGHLDIFSKNTIAVGGDFSKIGDIYASGLAAYTSEKGFSKLFGATLKRNGFYPPIVHDIHITKGKEILVAGIFDSLYQSIQGLSSYKRQSPGFTVYNPFLGLWLPVVNSLGGGQDVFATSKYKGQYLIGGNFTSVDGTTARGLAIRDTSNNTWQELANVGSGYVQDILVVHDSLIYIGGTFSTINGQNIGGVAVYDGTTWSGLGQGFGFYKNVYALGWDSLTQEVAIGGSIEYGLQTDGTRLYSEGLIFWDGATWSTRGKVVGRYTNPNQYAPIVRSIEVANNGEIYVGGEFSSIAGVTADRIATYVPNQGWQALAFSGVSQDACSHSRNPAVNAISLLPGQNSLFLGGTFNAAGIVQAGKFAKYNLGVDPAENIIDSIRSYCLPTYIWLDTSFKSIQWSIGGTGYKKEIKSEFMDVPEKWITVSGQKHNCYYTDSLLLVEGENILVYPDHRNEILIDTNQLTVALYTTATHSFLDSVMLNYGDGTIETYSVKQALLPDTFYHTYAIPGDYEIVFWSENFCGGQRHFIPVKLGMSPISDLYALGFDLYPNPNKGNFQVKYQGASGGGIVQLEVFDMMGRSLWKREVRAQELADSQEIQIQRLTPGRYFLRIQDGDQLGRKIFVVE